MFAAPIHACYMKGRQNYLCRQKLYDAEREPLLTGFEERREFQIIRDWEKTTATGDRSELHDIPETAAPGGNWTLAPIIALAKNARSSNAVSSPKCTAAPSPATSSS